MKKLSGILICCALAASVFAMGRSSFHKISGHIEYFGNAPFEFAGFITDDGKTLSIETENDSAFSTEDIAALYGNHLELKGYYSENKDSPKKLKDGLFVVTGFKKIK